MLVVVGYLDATRPEPFRALVIVCADSSSTITDPNLAGKWPHYLLHPGDGSGNFDEDGVLNDPDYAWSLSNFFYYDSRGHIRQGINI